MYVGTGVVTSYSTDPDYSSVRRGRGCLYGRDGAKETVLYVRSGESV